MIKFVRFVHCSLLPWPGILFRFFFSIFFRLLSLSFVIFFAFDCMVALGRNGNNSVHVVPHVNGWARLCSQKVLNDTIPNEMVGTSPIGTQRAIESNCFLWNYIVLWMNDTGDRTKDPAHHQFSMKFVSFVNEFCMRNNVQIVVIECRMISFNFIDGTYRVNR